MKRDIIGKQAGSDTRMRVSTNNPPPATAGQSVSHGQTRLVFFLGFGGLLLLLAILGVSAISFLSQIRVREETIRRDYVVRDQILQNLRSGIYTSGTHIRDFLLDTDESLAAEQREQFTETRLEIQEGVAAYRKQIQKDEEQPFLQFSEELSSYMNAIAPVLNWSPAERHARASVFVQEELLPRRMNALSLADRIRKISEAQLERSSDVVNVMLASFRAKLLALLLLAFGLGVALAGAAFWRLLRLEAEARIRFNEVVSTREELKHLSDELVSAQESERRRISRELHDEVGQVLSAIMLGLGNLRSAVKEGNGAEALNQLRLVEDMTERNASVVRNLSLLLRPTMLDDLGLVPALKWYAREVSRNGPMAVEVTAESFADDLPESHRTCVFRIAQEAVRNAARHSGASLVRIALNESDSGVSLEIQDNGKGFDPGLEAGLGILGMRERVMRLSGKLQVRSSPREGTALHFWLPFPAGHRPGGAGTSEAAQEISPLRTA